MKLNRLCISAVLFASAMAASAQEEMMPFGDFDQWYIRNVKESGIIGGKTKTLYEVAKNANVNSNEKYRNMDGSPWGTSNVLAKVAGITKTNTSVFREEHNGGYCARLYTHYEKVKVAGVVDIHVLAAGSLFTGEMIEPITGTSNPMAKFSMGIPFTRKPKAIKFDYKVDISKIMTERVKRNGLSKMKKVSGQDQCDCIVMLQKRWEDSNGNVHAKRVGTMVRRFAKDTGGWKDNQQFTINYGDITGQSWYADYMGLRNGGEDDFYTMNSKGKLVRIIEEGWGSATDTPTHLIVKFDSSHGGAFVGAPGNTLCVDNVRLVY